MAEEFKLPGSSFEELNKIIQGYATLEKPSSLDDVSKTIGMRKETISRNVGFLVAIGILEGRRDKSSTSLGKDLGKALLHGQDDDIRRNYFSAASESDFLKSVTNAIRIRKGMDEGSLRSHIAYSAGAKKNAYTTAGSGAVIELLKVAGTINEEEGKIVVASETLKSSARDGGLDEAKLVPVPQSPSNVMPFYGGGEGRPTTTGSAARDASVQIKINVNVNCQPSELDGLGEKLRGILGCLKDQKVEVDGSAGDKGDNLQD